jgi:hypothetical protein
MEIEEQGPMEPCGTQVIEALGEVDVFEVFDALQLDDDATRN